MLVCLPTTKRVLKSGQANALSHIVQIAGKDGTGLHLVE